MTLYKFVQLQDIVLEEGKRDIQKIEHYVEGRLANPHTTHPIADSTPTPQIPGHKTITVGTPQFRTDVAHPVAIPHLPELPQAVHTASTTMPFHQLDCPHGDLMTFWKHTTDADRDYVTPFAKAGPEVKYVTFEPGNSCK